MTRTTVALGLACDIALWGLWMPAVTCWGLAFAVGVVALLMERSVGSSIQVGLECGLVVMAIAGLVAALGWAGALMVFLVAASSPWGRTLVRAGRLDARRRRADVDQEAVRFRSMDDLESLPRDAAGGSVTPMVAVADMPGADGVPALDDGALCQAWRRSYVRLEASRAAEARLEVVRLRQVYLDELVRRHPREVRHWLESGARAAGNPMPFIRRPCRDGRSDDAGRENGRGR